MTAILFLYFSCLSFSQPLPTNTVIKYGPVIHGVRTLNQFKTIQNTTTPKGIFQEDSKTVIIQGYPRSQYEYATFFLDIGENNGNKVGINPFRVMVTQLDPKGNTTRYEALHVLDVNGTPIDQGLGRVDGQATYGPNGKIYFITNSVLNNKTGAKGYLIEFNIWENIVHGYPFNKDFHMPFVVTCGPQPSGPSNPSTLIYGGTSEASQVWWFDPSNPQDGIRYVRGTYSLFPEIDSRQNGVTEVVGKGNWIYVTLKEQGIEAKAYKSLYAINIVSGMKYLLFQSTENNFSVVAKVINQNASWAGEENVYLKLDNGLSPGTIYTDPLGIDMDAPPPAGTGSNCPCYNIKPTVTQPYLPYVQNILNYCTSFYFSDDQLTHFTPEFTKFRYNYNYALSRTSTPGINALVGPIPTFNNGILACNKDLDPGDYVNVPWDLIPFNPLPSISPSTAPVNVPSNHTSIYFKITDQFIRVNNSPADMWCTGTNYVEDWFNNDPLVNKTKKDKPKTSWDELDLKLTYEFFTTGVNNIEFGIQSVNPTHNLNFLADYDADLSGLCMTASSSKDFGADGAPTLVKGAMKEGFAKLNPFPNTFGYVHDFVEKVQNEANDILAIGEDYNGHHFGTNLMAGYPGGIDIYNMNNANQTIYTSQCVATNAPLNCNPRRICNMGSIENLLDGGIKQYGPETPVGARIYSPDFYAPSSGGDINYKLITTGVATRERQGTDVVIGIYDFTYNQNTNIVTKISDDVVDFNSKACEYFADFKVLCIANEATSLGCIAQDGPQLRNINAPYNDGVGYYTPNPNNPNCQPQYLRMVMCVRKKTVRVNELWIFNPANNKVEQRVTFPLTVLNLYPITHLQTIGDRYIAMTQGSNRATGNTNLIFMFSIEANGTIDATKIIIFNNDNIQNLQTFFVTGNTNSFYGVGNIFKVFFAYNAKIPVNANTISSFDIVAENNRQDFHFDNLFTYDCGAIIDPIKDFAYVAKSIEYNTTDLLMVGGKNLYIIKDVVPMFLNEYNKLNSKPTVSITTTPNPFTNSVSIKTKGLKKGMYNLSLIDNTGKVVCNQKIALTNNLVYQWQLPTTLSKGLYIVQLQNQSNKVSAKVIKQ